MPLEFTLLATTRQRIRPETGPRRALEAGLQRSDDLWIAWLRAAAVDLRRGAKEILDGFPACPVATPEGVTSLHADLIWALGSLVADGALRIHCGGAGFRSKAGAHWSGDRCFRSGLAAYLEEIASERYPMDEPALYHTERWFRESADPVPAYRIPLTPGTYRVTLHFVEGAEKPPEGRAFGILLEGKEVDPSCVALSVGFGVPLVKTFTVPVEDGFLDIAFKRKQKNPEVVGIEVAREAP